MSTSILTDVKKLLGFDSTYTAFDTDIIIGINSAIGVLYQLGVANDDECVVVTGTTETWDDIIDDAANLEMIKQYVYLRTRRIFDPPASSSVMQAIDNEVKELEWRIQAIVDPGEEAANE